MHDLLEIPMGRIVWAKKIRNIMPNARLYDVENSRRYTRVPVVQHAERSTFFMGFPRISVTRLRFAHVCRL